MKRWVIAVSAAAMAAAALPAAAGEWRLTLDQAIERAVAQNRDIAIARERLAEFKGFKAEVRSAALPQVTATAGYQRAWRRPELFIDGQSFRVGTTHTYSAGAQANQLLFDGGRVFKAMRAARSEEARGLEEIEDAIAEVRLEVKRTFYEILYMDKAIAVLEGELRQLAGHFIAIKARYREGLESDYALMRQEVALSNIEPQIIDAKRNKELLVNGLKLLLAVPQEDPLSIAGEFDYRARALPEKAELLERARSSRPDLKAERLRERSLDLSVGMERAGYWPSLSLNTSFEWQGLSNDWRVGRSERFDAAASSVNLSWPIFEGFKTRARVRQARAKLAQQSLGLSRMEDSAAREASDAFDSLLRAREALASQQRSLATARRASAIAGERFKAGLLSQIELNDTISAQATAEQNYLRAAFDCLSSEAALEKATGGEL